MAMINSAQTKQSIKQAVDQQIEALVELSQRIERSNLPNLTALDELPDILKARRSTMGISVTDLADLASISANTYRAMERQGANPSLQSLVAVCEVLNLKLWVESA